LYTSQAIGQRGVTVSELFLQADEICSKVYPDYRKLFKCLLVGIVATVVQVSVMFLLTGHVAAYAYVISYHAGLVVSFVLNKTFTFRNSYNKYHFQFASFLAVAYSQLLLNFVIFYAIMYHVIGVDTMANRLIATIIAAFFGFVFSFIVNKSLTFRIFK